MLHVLAISASVTRLRWRPPAFEGFVAGEQQTEDRHASMMAVATAPIKGASAGGAGVLALWSFHRPFMPLSVVQGHKDGGVTDFDWLETPVNKDTTPSPKQQLPDQSKRNWRGQAQDSSDHGSYRSTFSQLRNHEIDSSLHDNAESDDNDKKPVGIWQHVLSVGRDGRCIIQSFVRGTSATELLFVKGTYLGYLNAFSIFVRKAIDRLLEYRHHALQWPTCLRFRRAMGPCNYFRSHSLYQLGRRTIIY